MLLQTEMIAEYLQMNGVIIHVHIILLYVQIAVLNYNYYNYCNYCNYNNYFNNSKAFS